MKKILILCTTDSMIYNFLISHIKELKNNNYEIECACSKTGFYFNDIKKECKIKMHELNFTRTPLSIRNLIAYKNLSRIVKNNKYDIIFCHEPVGGVMGRLVGHKNKCKIIYMAHGFHFFKGAPLKNNILYYNIEKYFSKYTDILITINNEDYMNSTEKFKAKKNIKLNGIGIDTTKFVTKKNDYLRKKYNLKKNDILLLSVGELIDRKNHIVVIKAIEKMKNKNLHYFIAGDGKNTQKLQQYIKEHHLENNIHLLGYCKNINELCNSVDIFVFPSLQEGLSVALMEAMACGNLIIASKIRGNVDLIDEEKGGFLVEANNISDYITSINKAITEIKNKEKYSNYNKEKIKLFDIQHIKNDIIQLINER